MRSNTIQDQRHGGAAAIAREAKDAAEYEDQRAEKLINGWNRNHQLSMK